MNNQLKPFGGISGSTLKLFAIITMLIDHTGATVLRAILRHPAVAADPALDAIWTSVYSMSRSLGRLAFPIFCFLVVEGFTHTRNVRKYAGRLFLFALISEVPFDIALKGSWYFPNKQNVYFTLLIGLLVLIGISFVERFCTDEISIPGEVTSAKTKGNALYTILSVCLTGLIIYSGMYLATCINTDYNYKGVFLIAALYLTRKSSLFQCLTGAVSVAWELPASAAFLPVYLYNGKRGINLKYIFYWFYPVHLMVLYVIANYIIPAI